MARIWRHQLDSIKLHHVGMEVANMEESQFFFEVLGFIVKDLFQYEEERVCLLQKDGFILELVQPLNYTVDQPELHLAFCVDNLDVAQKSFKDLEWEEPVTYPNGWTSAFMKVEGQFYVEWLKIG